MTSLLIYIFEIVCVKNTYAIVYNESEKIVKKKMQENSSLMNKKYLSKVSKPLTDSNCVIYTIA